MKQAWDLSYLYLLSYLRRHIYAGTLLIAVTLVALPSYVSAFSMGLDSFERVAKDFGVTLVGFYSLAVVLLLGSTTAAKDLQTRALYPILARPVSRGVYLWGHLLALFQFLGASLILLTVALALGLGIRTGRVDFSAGVAIYGIFLQSLIIAAVCLVASLRCSPALAGTVGMAVNLLGTLSGVFIRFFLVEDRSSVMSATLAKVLKGVLPNLTLFSLKDPAVHHLPLPAGYLFAISYYALAWLAIVMLVGVLIFRKVDL